MVGVGGVVTCVENDSLHTWQNGIASDEWSGSLSMVVIMISQHGWQMKCRHGKGVSKSRLSLLTGGASLQSMQTELGRGLR